MSDQPGSTSLSVVIPTRDRPGMLANCLSRLLPELGPGDELIVVDSASRVPIEVDAPVRLIRTEVPGSSIARNIGWQGATHDIVAFVDDDVWVERGWADALRAAFMDPEVGMVTARVTIPEGQVAERAVAVRNDDVAERFDEASRTVFESTACCGFRRTVLASIAGFDERLGPGTWFAAAEDLDLYDRARRAGFVGRFDPTVRAGHDQWRSRGQLLRLEWRYGKGMGAHLWMLSSRDRRSAADHARQALWQDGLAKVGEAIRTHYEFAVVSQLVRLAGSLVGFVVAAFRLGHTTWPIRGAFERS